MTQPCQAFVFADARMAAALHDMPSERDTLSYARGFDDGQAAANAQVMRAHTLCLERLEATIGQIRAEWQQRWIALEREAADLAVASARCIGDPRVTADDIARVVTLAIADLHDATRLTIRLSPSVVAEIEAQLPMVLANGPDAALILSFIADPALSDEDFLLEWRDGSIRRDRAAMMACVETSLGRAFQGARPLPHEEPL